MTLRFLAFACCLALGALAGWLLGGSAGAAAGVAAGALAWFTIESFRARRVLRWLREGQLRGAPSVGGWWGEAGERARRALAARELRAEDAERRLEAFLDAIRGSPNGVVLLDPQGRIEWCNQTASLHFGLDPVRDLQQHIVNLVRDPDFAGFYHGGNYTRDVIVEAPASSATRPRRLSLYLHPYGEGRRLLLSRDVTEVEQAEAMRRDFVANVSHEIRTPLTVLSGFVETLQTLDLPKEERQRYLGMMAQQAQRMQTLVQDLLTLSRLEGSPLPGKAEWTPVASLLAQAEQEARALAANQGKRLDLRFPEACSWQVAGAASELQSALSNLVSNAVRYTPGGGTVEVQARTGEDGRLELAVRDSGPGIAADHLPRLTERFYRVDRSRSRESGGTGLGLAIVKHVVQRHGGELRIESAPRAGSTFTLVLPAGRVRAAELTPAGSDAPPATGSAAG
ncbi:phosphate regulon sensor histidine kinase PhoR [Ramlibacter sp. USB13]|uniref:Phosphate regulon sensor protein PhoR n=1 Tax=Ramlibacter cellulosilyticus TaxID=2764187 RepID=A0A923MQZ5_9BURK|nr:phosphate regulon sensor histidine kinase PhoR [Ramlibacter cellulosilyticus]MBC5783351.1 phosphate regulon sensor histidine kinase PhoR [Ramlibacter cellulosilyticus]